MFVQREYLIPRARGVRQVPTLRGNVHSPRPAIYIYREREREMCLYVGPISIYYFLMFVQKRYLFGGCGACYRLPLRVEMCIRPAPLYIYREREMCLYVGPISKDYFLMFVQKEYLIPRARGVLTAPTLRGNVHSPRPAIYI